MERTSSVMKAWLTPRDMEISASSRTATSRNAWFFLFLLVAALSYLFFQSLTALIVGLVLAFLVGSRSKVSRSSTKVAWALAGTFLYSVLVSRILEIVGVEQVLIVLLFFVMLVVIAWY